MKARLAKLESIVQGYIAKDSISAENYRYLQENMETVLYAIQEASKVEEMQKALEWYADEKNYELFDANVTEYSYETTSAIWEDEGERARQALKGDPNERLTRNS